MSAYDELIDRFDLVMMRNNAQVIMHKNVLVNFVNARGRDLDRRRAIETLMFPRIFRASYLIKLVLPIGHIHLQTDG